MTDDDELDAAYRTFSPPPCEGAVWGGVYRNTPIWIVPELFLTEPASEAIN